MKFRKITGVLALGIALMLPTSCKKGFLDTKNTQNPTEGSLFKTSDDAYKLVNGIYDTFHNNDFLIKALWYQANFLVQDQQNWGSDTFFTTYQIPVDFSALYTFWQRAYAGITRANSALQILPTMKANGYIDAATANKLTGEAYFLRGVFYYYLATNFGGVPLELKLVTDNGRHPRNTQDEVFAQVVSDMTNAVNLLKWRYGDPLVAATDAQPATEVGRATKGAAYAYMGDAQMWLKKYADAVKSYTALDGHYTLESDFSMIHDFNNQNGKEAIFSIQYIAGVGADMNNNASNDTQWLTAFCMPYEITNMGYAFTHPNYPASFEPGDLRLKWTVIGPGQTHPDPKISISNYQQVKNSYGGINTVGTVAKPWTGNDNGRSGYFNVKTWRDPNVNGRVGDAGKIAYQYSSFNQILMRYGGVLISKAEAQFKSGDEGGARTTLGLIRSRAGLSSSVSGDFMKAVTSEYRHELGGEFAVFYYIRREGPGVATQFVKDNYNITIPNGHELMPIPQTAIGVNATLTQNPGY